MPTIDEIQNDVACPACQYNLRGLHGAVVNCPECGLSIDVAKLISARWHGPWDQAPGYSTVQLPALLTLVLILPLVFLVAALQEGSVTLIGLAVVGVPLAVSLTCVVRVCRRFGTMEGIKVVIYAHLLLAMYVVGIVGTIGALGLLLSTQNPALLFFMALGAATFVGSRRIDRILAEGCIRQYLREKAAGL